MKKLLLLLLLGATFLGTYARSAHSHVSAGRHSHRHHHAYLTTREEQKPQRIKH